MPVILSGSLTKMPELRQLLLRLWSGQPSDDGPLLTLEHTGVALAAAAGLPEGPVVPISGAGAKRIRISRLDYHVQWIK